MTGLIADVANEREHARGHSGRGGGYDKVIVIGRRRWAVG